MLIFFLFAIASFNVSFAYPTSAIDAGTGYEIPCSLFGLSADNISSYKIGSNTIAVENIVNYSSFQVPNKTVISANCKTGYYVFKPDKKPTDTLKTSFALTCQNGSFKRNVNTEYCDARCDISDLIDYGYRASKAVLDPGEKLSISCPTGKTTKTGVSFLISCSTNGLIKTESTACFPILNSCQKVKDGKQTYFPEGSRLVCSGESSALTTVACEKSAWEDNAFYTSEYGASCKETIGEVNFPIEDINAISIVDIEDILTISEIIDFCIQNPTDKECQASFTKCKYQEKEYEMGHELVLYCAQYKTDIAYLCVESWIFKEFIDKEHELASSYMIPQQDCGDNAPIISSTPKASRSLNSARKQTLKEYKEERRKEEREKRRKKS